MTGRPMRGTIAKVSRIAPPTAWASATAFALFNIALVSASGRRTSVVILLAVTAVACTAVVMYLLYLDRTVHQLRESTDTLDDRHTISTILVKELLALEKQEQLTAESSR